MQGARVKSHQKTDVCRASKHKLINKTLHTEVIPTACGVTDGRKGVRTANHPPRQGKSKNRALI